MAQHVLGVDLGAHAVKAVLLESSYRGFAVVDHATAAVPPPEGEVPVPLRDRQAAALRALLSERGWRVDVAVASLPGATSAAQVVTLPFTDTRRIEQTIPFEVEGQIPFDLSEVAWDWQPMGIRDGKSDLFVGVARKEELASLLGALAAAGIDPRTVIPAAPAYAALFTSGVLEAGPPPEPGAPPRAEAVVDVLDDRANVCIVERGTCVAARTFAFGASHDARALARELRATIRAWHARVGPRRLDRVHLAGDVERVAGLAELLSADVDGPIEPLRLGGPALDKLPAEAAGALALPLALAIRGHEGSRAPRLNLRRGEFAYTRDFQHVKGKVARLGAWTALVLALAVVSAGVKVFVLARQETALDRALCEAEEKIIGRCFESFEQAEAVLRGRGPGQAAIPRASAVELLAELGSRAPAGVQLRFDRIEITREKLHLQGTTAAAEDVDKIVTALRASSCFGDARSGGARRRGSDGKFEFSVDSAITCPDGPAAAAAGRRL